MGTRPSDTSEWAFNKQIEILRAMTPARRFEIGVMLSVAAWNGARAAVDRQFPHETQDQRDLRFYTQCYGRETAERLIAMRQKCIGPQNETLA